MIRNNFYGVYVESEIHTIFNDAPGNVKSFKYMSYEGSQAKITPLTPDSLASAYEYYTGNLTLDASGNVVSAEVGAVSFNN